MNEHHGGCHCGNIRWTLRSRLQAAELPARACQCDFCLKHAALSTSDPDGAFDFAVRDRAALVRYRFATGTAEFLSCAHCGVYVGAQMTEAGRHYAIANLNTLDHREPIAYRATPFDYSGEDAAARLTRRSARWTPLRTIA